MLSEISQTRKKKKLQKDTNSYQSEWPSLKSLQIINAGESVKKRELSFVYFWLIPSYVNIT